MNNKGLTIVELITTFALTAVIIVLLMNIIVVIKNIYSKANIKTELYINQSNLSNTLNSKINRNNLESYERCDDSEFCYIFNFVDGESIKLTVNKNKIKFGEYVYTLKEKTNVEYPTLIDEHNFINIRIPIFCELYPNIDFGINLVYLGNPTEIVL